MEMEVWKNRGKKAIVLEKLFRAIAAREPLRAAGTDALRLVDGAGDGIEGLELDDFAGRWLAQTRDREFPAWLRGVTGPRALYWKQLGDRKEAPAWIEGQEAREPFVVMENGMRFQIDFTAGYSQGIFLDQRGNRAEARRRAHGAARTELLRLHMRLRRGRGAGRGGDGEHRPFEAVPRVGPPQL